MGEIYISTLLKGGIELPAEIVAQWGIRDGDAVELCPLPNGFLIRPVSCPNECATDGREVE